MKNRTIRLSLLLLVCIFACIICTRRTLAQWAENGNPVSTGEGNQAQARIVSDGSGGAIIAWGDWDGSDIDIYAQRIFADGNVQWTTNGVTVCAKESRQGIPIIVSDGAGGAIIAWQDMISEDEYHIYAQRIDTFGDTLWAGDGVPVCMEPYDWKYMDSAPDGAGGAFIVWNEQWGDYEHYIVAQRIDANGASIWAVGGIDICTAAEWVEDPTVLQDGAGGAFIAWVDWRNSEWIVRVQRVDGDGNHLWAADGITLCAQNGYQYAPEIVPDGDDGIIVVWCADRGLPSEFDIFAQRIDAGGNRVWADGCVPVSMADDRQERPKLTPDGAGGAIVVWRDYRDDGLHTQRIDSLGVAVWAIDEDATEAPGEELDIVSDGAGGAIIVWGGSGGVHAQAVDAAGNILWTTGGVAICAGTPATHYQPPRIEADGSGGAIIAWSDNRSGDYDIYAQRTGLWGAIALPELPFGITTAGDTATAALILNNHLVETLTLQGTPLDDGLFYFGPGFRDSLETGVTIEPGAYASGQVYFNPLEGGDFERRIYFRRTGTGDTVATTLLRGRGRPLSYSWSNADDYQDRLLDAEDTLIVRERMDDFVEIDSLVLFHAEGASAVYHRKRMDLVVDDPFNDIYEGWVPAAEGGCRGIDFYTVAYNGQAFSFEPPGGSPERLRVEIDNLVFDGPQPVSVYDMVSFPVEIPDNTIVGVLNDDLGGAEIAEWRMFAYLPDSLDYEEVPSEGIVELEQGRAYWLITKDPDTLDTAPKAAVSTPAVSPFTLVLSPGWNMIGNPFAFPVAWDSVLVNGVASYDQGDVEPPVWWNPGSGEYEYMAAVLEPFEGYWVKNLAGASAVLAVLPVEAAQAPLNPQPLFRAAPGDAGGGWRLCIRAACNGVSDGQNVAGISGGADARWDRLDRSEAPMNPGRAVALYFPHGRWPEHPGLYSVDIRDTDGRVLRGAGPAEDGFYGHAWLFDVAKSFSDGEAGDEVVLSFEGIDGVPDGAELYLVDRGLGKVQDLRSESVYRFFLGERPYKRGEGDARFLLLAGSREFIEDRGDGFPDLPAATVLYPNYPNPFNPATIVRYDIASFGRVEIRIFDVRGALVKTLYSGDRRPGRYEASWDGRGQDGLDVESGVYFCRLRSGGFTDVRKLILLR